MTIQDGPSVRTDTLTSPPDVLVQAPPAQPLIAAPAAPLAPVTPVAIVAPVAPVATHPDDSQLSSISRSSRSRFEPDALITAAIGLVLAVIGLIAVIRGGFDGPMAQPVVDVLGFTHTTTLGIIEIMLGLALLLSGASRSRSAETLFGIMLGVAGFVGAVQSESFTTSLALETSFAWIAALAGAVVVMAALVLPRFAMRSTSVRQQ